VRVPVLRFLQASPQPEAKAYIEELSKIDPAAAKRAASFFPFKPPEKKDAAGSDAPAADNSPKTASQTSAPTAVVHQEANHRTNKPLVVDSASRPKASSQAAVLFPRSVEPEVDVTMIQPMHLYMAFVAGAAVLGLMMWSLLCGSARYEKIAAHGVRRK
jgi:hypothetical protein